MAYGRGRGAPGRRALGGRSAPWCACRTGDPQLAAGTGDNRQVSRTRVLLVTGFGRSGSTLLNTVLGSTAGVFAGGEIRFLWERGLKERRTCGCGEPVTSCAVWRPILEKAFGDLDAIDVDRLVAEDAKGTRTRVLPQLALARFAGDRVVRELPTLPTALARLYAAVPDVTGASLVVDTSKPPSFGYVLDHVPEIDLRIVHLVRDPRAAAYSWTRTKALTDGAARATMQQLSPSQSAVHWTLWNAAAEWFWANQPERYLRVSYEELVGAPRATVERILTFAGHPVDGLPFIDDRTLRVATVHSVAGNPNRMSGGTITIAADDEWAGALNARARRTVTALSAPLIAHYRYPFSLGRRSTVAAGPTPRSEDR